MGYIRDLVDEFLYKAVQRRESKAEPLTAQESMYEPQPAELPYLIDTYTKFVWSYVATWKISTSLARVHYKFFREDDDKKTQLRKGPLVELMKRPNPIATRSQIWETTLALLELTGVSYWEVVREPDTPEGDPIEIFPLRSDRVTPIPDPKNLIAGYEYTINARKIFFKPTDVIRFVYFNPTSDLYGLGSQQVATNSSWLDHYALIFNQNFFKLGARIGGTLESDRTTTKPQRDALEASFNALVQGYRKAFRWIALPPGVKAEETKMPHREGQFIELSKQVRENILSMYGVYPACVGLFEYSNYANADKQQEMFWTDTIIPKGEMISERVNRDLIFPWKENVWGEFDWTGIEALQEIYFKRARALAVLVTNGIMKANEARRLYNLAPVDWGDQWWIPRGRRSTEPHHPVGEPTDQIPERKPTREQSGGDGGDGDLGPFTGDDIKELRDNDRFVKLLLGLNRVIKEES